MTEKIALEEHVAIPEYNQDRLPFLDATWWNDVHRRLVDFEELRLPTMDQHGIGFAVVSLTTPGVQGAAGR